MEEALPRGHSCARLEQPWKVVGLCRRALLTPRDRLREARGFRNERDLPGGMILRIPARSRSIRRGQTVECLHGAVDDLSRSASRIRGHEAILRVDEVAG